MAMSFIASPAPAAALSSRLSSDSHVSKPCCCCWSLVLRAERPRSSDCCPPRSVKICTCHQYKWGRGGMTCISIFNKETAVLET